MFGSEDPFADFHKFFDDARGLRCFLGASSRSRNPAYRVVSMVHVTRLLFHTVFFQNVESCSAL